MQQTSLESYIIFKEHFNRLEREIMRLLENHPRGLTDIEISRKTGIKINSVTGRRNSLVKKGVVESFGSRLNNDSEVRNKIWRLKRQW